MNIKEAKTEIINTVRAYTRKNSAGEYCIPAVRQRPILLIGPPGIGKTAIMEQAARACGVGLVAYTITHHTRQSAVGLPVVVKKNWQGREYTATEYTMSEIIASIYECMSCTGCREGILFIDEINCVSETLAPTMLQLLQNKTFGAHAVPPGWVIAAAGNPREYNKSVREFDVVTLDRVKRIDVEADLDVWREYAMEHGLHPAILGYLGTKKENFYRVEAIGRQKQFVTARGWEDLSVLLQSYEEMGIPAGEEVILEYLQEPQIAADFAAYYELCRKYQMDYDMPHILDGTMDPTQRQERIDLAKKAGTDERLMAADLILGVWNSLLADCSRQENFVEDLYDTLCREKKALDQGGQLQEFLEQARHAFEAKREARLLSWSDERREAAVLRFLERCLLEARKAHAQTPGESWKITQRLFAQETQERSRRIDAVQRALSEGFSFAGEAFGDGLETTFLAADLAANPLGAAFLGEHGCEAYFQYSGSLQTARERQKLQKEIEGLENGKDQ